MTMQMMKFDERFMAAATLSILAAHDGLEFTEVFPIGPADMALNTRLESGKLAYLLHSLIEELTSGNKGYRDAVMENVLHYQENPESHFGFSIGKE